MLCSIISCPPAGPALSSADQGADGMVLAAGL